MQYHIPKIVILTKIMANYLYSLTADFKYSSNEEGTISGEICRAANPRRLHVLQCKSYAILETNHLATGEKTDNVILRKIDER
jgi:hypothetical protein